MNNTDNDNDNNSRVNKTEQRGLARKQQKSESRSRRAALLLDKNVEEKARQDAFEKQQSEMVYELKSLQDRLEAQETRIQALEDAAQ